MSEIYVDKCEHYDNGFCDKYYDVECADECKYKQLQQLKQRLNEYEKDGGVIDEGQAWSDEAMVSRVKLEKIKPILEYYANSKIGTLQDNGTYKIDCGGDAVIGSFSCQLGNPFGLPSTFTYDPRPAKEGLKIIGDELITELQQLKAERDLLLNQLVVLDGEDVTVQVTQEQFEEYNRLKAELQAYKDKVKPVNFVDSDEYLKVVIENKQLKAENDELKFMNKYTTQDQQQIEKLHIIIDRLLEHSGYSTDTVSAEEFECVYDDMDYKQGKLEDYKKCLDEIEEYIYTDCEFNYGCDRSLCIGCKHICIQDQTILQLIKQAKEGENG